MKSSDIRIVVTGVDWLGSGIGSIETSLEELIREAKEQIDITAYSVTSGADLLFKWINVALERGIKIRIIVNKPESQPAIIVNKLERLATKYKHFALYYFIGKRSNLHAKMIIADRFAAVVGSSNLSKSGLLLNYEVAAYVKGEPVEQLANTLEKLFNSKNIVKFNSLKKP
ncbi:MAG: phospholipase D family protein [Pyrinomonadaceae bacterium]|nr:phospholipase D family protein [Pyrinomonadaceae bacterium]